MGVSAHRLRGAEAGTAFVAAVRRDTFEEVGRWELPSREVYDVVFAPEPLIEAVCTGQRRETLETGTTPTSIFDQDGNRVKLSESKLQTLVLILYPRST